MTNADEPAGGKLPTDDNDNKPAKPSLEDALAAHEKRKAQAMAAQDANAEEIAAAAERRAALQKKLDALPQRERRQVLDAAGLKHVSAAPPPPSHIRGSYAPAKPKAPDVSKPDWRFWTKIKAVKVWQAIVLSLDIDPDGMKHHPDAWMAGPGNGPIFEDRSFPSNAVKVEYGKRVRLLRSAITNPDYFYIHKINSNGALCEIYLRDFVKWALAIDLGDMPPELVAMAKAPDKNSVSAPSSSGRITIEKLAWEIAQAKAAEHPENWNHEDGDPMNKTVVAAINKHGWEPDGIPGLLPLIIAMADAKEISPKSTFNDCPPTTTTLIQTKPDNWYLSEADARVVRERFSNIDAQNLATVASAESNPTSETPAQRRKNHDMTEERGTRALILEHWDDIEKLHPRGVNGRQVWKYLKARADPSDKNFTQKTVQNHLPVLRKEGLIP
jgi:hypothetical protein